MSYEEHLYTLALRQCKNLGNTNLRKMIAKIGSAKNIWEASPKSLLDIEGIGKARIKDIGNKEYLTNAEEELKLCEQLGISIVAVKENHYPNLLANCDDAPLLLFYKGDLNAQKNHLSIVGTRMLTNYGKTFVQTILKDLADSNLATISGLAIGADTCVHEESIRNNIATMAVMAQNLSTIYPAANKRLANKILDHGGAIITEYATFDGISKEYFLRRNRIIAGLSPHLIVVETAYGGGSITTANCANGYNRDVFALPGKITDVYSQGCNQLIAQNKAEAIVNIKSLIQNLSLAIQPQLFEEEKIKIDPSQHDHHQVFEIIKENKPISLDNIAEKSGILQHKLLPILLDLELHGHIKCLSGRQYLPV